MPTLISHIAIDLHELFQDSAVAACALRRVSRRVVEMAVDVSLMLVVRVLWTEQRWAHRTREVLDMELFV